MSRRQDVIASSIQYSIINTDKQPLVLDKLPSYFYVYHLTFVCVREDLFTTLRRTWQIDEDDHHASFGRGNWDERLQSMEAMGRIVEALIYDISS